ncbi:protoporphyrinogen oxidase [Nibribacter koreensis]|uniref:Coproporphyrinogen III oxidase n=1 Tax=Nibribacter koreensis TaxID=1084519 RepID=A0ABP8FF94_9BACT
MRVAIIGAGISGLALAYYLQKLGVRYDLFEASDQVGGMLKSCKQGSYQFELGPNSLQDTPELEELLQELKLQEEKVKPSSVASNRFILKDGKYQKLPVSPLGMLFHPFFDWRTKLRIARETQCTKREVAEETITHFFARRFGTEVVEYLVKPMVAGIYGGDPDQLLLEKTMPFLQKLERKHGSVLKGLVQAPEIRRRPIFTLKSGLETLANAISSKLVSLHTGQRIEMVHKLHGKYLLSIQNDVEGLSDEEYDAVVIALPAYAAADLLNYVAPGLSASLFNVNYAPMAVVHTAYHREQVKFPLNGYGALNPKKEGTFTAGSVWTSALFPHCAPSKEVFFTTFVGGTQWQQHLDLPRQEIMEKVHQELKTLYGISAKEPTFQHYHRWAKALPQPDVFILDVHLMAQALEEEHLYCCANWMAGPSVPDCIAYAKSLAHKINSQRPSF